MGTQALLWLLHLGICQVLTAKIQERYSCDSGIGRGRIIIVTYGQRLHIKKKMWYREKTLLDTYLSWDKDISLSPL